MATRPDFLKALNTVRTGVTNNIQTLSKLNTLIEGAVAPDANDRGVYKEVSKALTTINALLTRVAAVELPKGTLSPAKRGRPPKAAGAVVAVKPAKVAKVAKAVKVAAVAVAPKKRGRPPKVVVAPVVAKVVKKVVAAVAVAVAPKKRGRPPKAKVEVVAVPNGAAAVAPRKRGRPRKVDVMASPSVLN